MSNISAFIAQGQHTQGINPMGLHLGVERMNRSRNQNAESVQNQQITQRNIDEFDAGAGSREDARVRQSIIAGAQGAMPYIQAQDAAGLTRYFEGRIATVKARGGDASHSIEGLIALQSGDPKQINQAIQTITSIASQGQQEGQAQLPSRIQVANHYATLGDGSTQDRTPRTDAQGNMHPSAAQASFITANRNTTSVQDINNVTGNFNSATGGFTPIGGSTAAGTVQSATDLSAGKEAGTQQAQIAGIAPKAEETERVDNIINAPERLQKAEVTVQKTNDVIEEINLALPLVSGWTDGVTGAVLSFKPGSDRADLDVKIETIKSRLGIGELQAMRDLSKSGSSGMGQLNKIELEGLQGGVASLSTKQSGDQLVGSLHKIRRHFMRQQIVARNIIALNEGRMTEQQAEDTTRRQWLGLDQGFLQQQNGASFTPNDEGRTGTDSAGNRFVIRNGEAVPIGNQ